MLGLSKTATADDIRKEYRKLARKHHPDLNPNDKGANLKFQQLNEANEVLSDPEKRKKYDEYGENWKHADQYENAKQQGGYRQPSGRSGQESEGDFSGGHFSDFFESLFGNSAGGGREVKYRGQDYTAELRMNLKEAYETHQHTMNVGGKAVRITVAAGISNGQVIKLKGHGGPGENGGPNGDLFITFIIAEDAKFKRMANDLNTTVEIDLYTAVLGGDTTIDTMSGKIKLKVKPETQNNTKVRLKGKGFPVYKKEGEYGDLIITYFIKIPTNLSEKQKELFKELSRS